MSKLKLSDVQILGEGVQIKNAILQRYEHIKDFYGAHDINMSYNSFRSYFYQEVITAPTFKCIMTRIFDADYATLFIPIPKQIMTHVQSIYDNIKKYDEEEDQLTFDYLIEQCKKESMNTELAMMYRAKARNYYSTNWINRCTEYYEYAFEALPRDEINKKVFFLCELAYDLTRENFMDKADKKYKQLFDMVRLHKDKLDNTTLHYYHYWRGISLMLTGVYDTAKDYFEKAVGYAVKNYEKAQAIANIGYAYEMLGNYDDALKFYNEALKYPDETNILTTASIYNNIAVLYKTTKDYLNALLYIEKALEISKKKYNFGKHMIYTSTYAEIQMKLGDNEAYKSFYNLLLSTKGRQMLKPDILNDIKSFIEIIDDIPCLDELSDIIIELKDASNSDGFIKGLFECLGYAMEKIRKLTKGV